MSGDLKGLSVRRLLAVIIFLGCPAILLGFAVLNLLDASNDHFAAAEKTMQIDAFTRRLNSPAADGKPLDLSPVYLGGTTRTLASATLQQRVVSAIATTTARLIETAPVDLPAPNNPSESVDVGLKATLDIDNNGLLQLLYALESGLPLLEIDTLSIRRRSADAGESPQQILRVDMLVRGHWRQRSI